MADEQNQDNQNPETPEQSQADVAEDLAARVQSLEEQLAAAQDQSLRVAAELQNIRRRAEQDVEKAHKFALEKFAGDLLAVRKDRLAQAAVQKGGPDPEISRDKRVGCGRHEIGVGPLVPRQMEAVRIGGVLQQRDQSAGPGDGWRTQCIGGLSTVSLCGTQVSDGGCKGQQGAKLPRHQARGFGS